MEGKIKSALNLLSHGSRGKVLSLDQQVNPQSPSYGLVREVLLKKHPNLGVIDPDIVLLKEGLLIMIHTQSFLIVLMEI